MYAPGAAAARRRGSLRRRQHAAVVEACGGAAAGGAVECHGRHHVWRQLHRDGAPQVAVLRTESMTDLSMSATTKIVPWHHTHARLSAFQPGNLATSCAALQVQRGADGTAGHTQLWPAARHVCITALGWITHSTTARSWVEALKPQAHRLYQVLPPPLSRLLRCGQSAGAACSRSHLYQ